MRIAKPLLMFSLSVFLLAVSWSFLTGQLGSVGPAHAQTTSPFVSMVSFANKATVYLAITDAGEVWRFETNSIGGAISSTSFLGQLGGGAIPTTIESLGSVKGKYGGGGGD